MGKITLQGWKNRIARQVPFIDIRPYSHNIIGLALSAVADDFGKEEANKLIDEFGLEEIGWSKVE